MIQPIIPKRQRHIIDVVHWDADAEFGVFPQGARAKEAVFAPREQIDECLVPLKRYLFKRSKRSYPDQFWGEVIAYRVGCCMGLEVPPAFAAVNSGTGYSAALIEWFYDDHQRFVHAGDFLQAIVPDFERTQGKQHNLTDAAGLLRAMAIGKMLKGDWRQWLADMLVFDAVIGNTDRHQDNWGFVFSPVENDVSVICHVAPLFDNGTSLGHERFIDRVQGWNEGDVDRYIERGMHHMGKTRLEGFASAKHAELVRHALTVWPGTREIVVQRLNLLEAGLPRLLQDLIELGGDVPLSIGRADFVRRLIARRLALLRANML
ncbi:HipA domain-containing protein [Paraburkholderia sp. MM5384-R2]|uniref:HipA domain-containing protein n=1 Tax=Paraburkholderia sp. MM5384-R2 TaxID=2723097 RepID=UPI00161E9635|nr:HipA domain-containing protein [Paraburkholderia sp. MM5384-R2]MBB5501561.1 hypothetical protein [Paraburkholderia sp. MM5384-R2]